MFVLTRREQIVVVVLLLLLFGGVVIKRHLDRRAERQITPTSEQAR
jgi:hypothetical protein